jgi:Holliday junction resolvasome RuvABC DNA-binding subunit
MLKSKKLITDSHVNNEDLVNVVMNQALEQIIKLTGVNKTHALALMAEQLSPEDSHQVSLYQPIIEQEESLFIHHLFN